MKKTLLAMLLCCVPATAMAGGSAGSIGVGAEVSSTGAPDLSVNYDAGAFHADGAFGFSDDRLGGPQNDFRVGARFYYHLHATALADFGVGGELYIEDQEGDDNTQVEILAGFQIRSFISTRPSYSFATCWPVSRKIPVSALSTLALWTTVTRLRLCRTA